MEINKRVLKLVISIVQIVMSAIFLALGVVDRLEVRIVYTSFLFTPCWIAALALPAGIMGLCLVNTSRPSSTLSNALSSVSMACATVSAVTVYHYQWTLNRVLVVNLWDHEIYQSSYFVNNKDKRLQLTDQENTMVAITSLVVVISIIEIAVAVGGAWSSDSRYQPRQHVQNQVNQAGNMFNQIGAGPIPRQPTYIAAQPMVAVPVSSHNVSQ